VAERFASIIFDTTQTQIRVVHVRGMLLDSDFSEQSNGFRHLSYAL